MLGVIIEISLSFYTLDLVIVAFLLSRDFPLFQGLALTLPPILAAEVPLSSTSTIGAYQGTFGHLKNGGERELLMKETDAFQIHSTPPPLPREKRFSKNCPIDYTDQDDGSDHLTATVKLMRMTGLFNICSPVALNLTHQKFATQDGDMRICHLPGSDIFVAL